MGRGGNFTINSYINAAAMTATITGAWIPIGSIDNIAFQVVSTAAGTPVGTISFEVSNSNGVYTATSVEPPSAALVTVLTLTTAQTTAATINNNTLNFSFEFNQMAEAWMRMKYTRSSGGTADTMSVAVSAKALS